MLGVHVEDGPSTQEIIVAFERCERWSRDDRKRLAYLAIFTGYIEGRKYSTPTRVSLARLVMELERFENYPWGRVAFKVLMDSVKGKDISGCYTINGFAQALQSESVNGTNAGRKSLPEDKGPDKEDARYLEMRDAALALCRAKSDRTRKLAASQQSPYTANSTAKVIIPNKKLYPGYNPFATIDKKKLKELADWLKTCLHYRTPLDKKPRTSRTLTERKYP
uniref:DUF1985 domain-containing protein n=1 Tax=Brassica oleracea var. oleracea TaxID=109376 RepID=A0A0D3DLL0_BRAOL